MSNKDDLHLAISAAQDAFMKWNSKTIKARAAIMTQVHVLLLSEMDALVDLIVIENGKNRAEAKASVAKGIETLEWAVSLPASVSNKTLTVSRGITCSESRDALGIVASIVPFNFPAMVPMWTVPIALVCGNVMILKPSEKVPLTMNFMMSLFHKAGVPNGVFQIVHGTASIVQDICAHPDIAAVTFVGSSKVAEIVASACHASHKRVLALGGAKNHLVALPDADFEMAASDIVASFAGCAGQRCMAASVLLLVGNEESMGKLVELVVAKAAALTRGTQAGQVGAIIDEASQKRYVARYYLKHNLLFLSKIIVFLELLMLLKLKMGPRSSSMVEVGQRKNQRDIGLVQPSYFIQVLTMQLFRLKSLVQCFLSCTSLPLLKLFALKMKICMVMQPVFTRPSELMRNTFKHDSGLE